MILKLCGLTARVCRSAKPRSTAAGRRCFAALRHCFLNAGSQVLDAVLPRTCMLCGQALTEPGTGLCPDCSGRFERITGPVCVRCGVVFSSPQGDDHLCGECIRHPVHYERARAAGVYAGELRHAIQLFKFSRRSMLAAPLADFAAGLSGPIGPQCDYAAIVPVPLHPRRLRARGYNQSLLLAQRLGRMWHTSVAREYLQRSTWLVPQTSLTRQQRRRAVRNAFVCRDRRYAGARLLLVDDVLTSGATADECARTLKRYGAAAVDVLTVARTLKDHPECRLSIA